MEGKELRCHADECLRMADNSLDPGDRAAWLRLAEIWLRSAFKADQREQRQGFDFIRA